jgi:ABC-type multidrug transport system fused ATPase/permease subunit
MMRADTPVNVSSDQARQMAIRELSKSQYHRGGLQQPPAGQPSAIQPSPSPLTQPPQASAPSHALAIVLIILAVFLLVAVALLVLRWLGKPRTDKRRKEKREKRGGSGSMAQEILTGAALHRRNAEQAAAAADFAEAIRERFRAVIATLDERGLLPERADRTADEAAADAGAILPAHAEVLVAAARAFDEVEYGEYVGTPQAYAVISEVDELVRTEQPGTLQLPTAFVPTVPGGAQ